MNPSPDVDWPRWGLLCLVFAAIVLLVELASLVNYPPHFVDESWFANAVWTWFSVGVNVDQMHVEMIDESSIGKTRSYVGQLPWLASMAALGLGFFQARFASWIVGVLLVVTVFQLARNAYGAATACLAVLFLCLDPSFIQASHYARQEILLSLFGVAALLCAMAAFQKERAWLHFLAGFLAGVGLEIHLNGIVFIVGIAAYYLYEGGWRSLTVRSTWLAALGGLGGVFVFAWFHLLPDPSGYLLYHSFDIEQDHPIPIVEGPYRLLKSLLGERDRFDFTNDSLGFGVMIVATLFVAWRRNLADKRILVYLGAAFFTSVALIGKKSYLYAILSTPFVVVLVASFFETQLREARELTARRGMVILLGVFIGIRILVFANNLIDHREYDYDASAARIASKIPDPNAKIMAMPTWWLGLHQYEFASSVSLVYALARGATLTETMERIGFDILIFDKRFRDSLVWPEEKREAYDLPAAEFYAYLKKHADLIGTVQEPVHGPIEIYSVRH